MKQIELFDNKINVESLILDQVLHLKNWKFIDLFAGIGGIRIPFSELGAECVFTSEWDKIRTANVFTKLWATARR